MSFQSNVFDTPKGRQVYDRRTLCEVLRQAYDCCVVDLHHLDTHAVEKLIKLLEEAFIAGVKMNDRLVEQKIIDIENGMPLNNVKEAQKKRAERFRLLNMLESNKRFIHEHQQ